MNARRFWLAVLLVTASALVLTENASACGRRSVTYCSPCYIPCCPCPPIVHPCYCIAYKNPYTRQGGYYFVRCDCCPGYLDSWHWCYVYTLKRYDWVLVHRCFYYGTPFDKDAKDAEGYKEGYGEASAGGSAATVVVNVPADAKVLIDGSPTASTSERRVFATPGLEAGKEYSYTVTAEFVRDGVAQAVSRRVTIRAAEQSEVDLRPASETSVAAR